MINTPEGPEKEQNEKQIKAKIRSIMAEDPHFFDNASEEVKAYVLGAMREGNALPKTGGIWGTGIMLALGILLIAAGAVLLFGDKGKLLAARCTKKQQEDK